MGYNNLELLDKLTAEERAMVKQILVDVSNKGKSKNLTELYYEDYDEIPVDLHTFFTSDVYLGAYTNHGKDIYETWKNEINYIHNPINAINQWCITGSIGTGKSLMLTEKLFTPNGYIQMKDVKLGDVLIDGMGKECNVTGIYPQGRQKSYKIKFSDNTYIICSYNHLWKVKNKQTTEIEVKTAEYLYNQIKNNNKEYLIPTVKINVWKTPDYIISPKELGRLYRYYNDKEYKTYYDSIYKLVELQNITSAEAQKIHKWITTFKIPRDYLYTSLEARKSFLRGFYKEDDKDIDQYNFVIKIRNKKLSKTIAHLIRSIGGYDVVEKANLGEYIHTISVESMYIEENVSYYKKIISIEPLRRKYKAQCIMVDSIDHTYITKDLIVTHNTQAVVYSLCYDLYKLMCLKNPSRFYGLGDDTIYMFFFNLTLKLSERTAYSRFQRAIQSSPWFLARGTISGKKYLEYVPNKNIRFDKGSNLQHALGSACMYCLDGNTRILTNKGPEYIKNLVGKDIKVYTVDIDGTIKLTPKVNVIETKKVTELIEIELEDGYKFRCTPEHLILLKDGTYKEAQYLTPEDELYEVDTNCGIYRLYTTKSNRCYIGQSKNLKSRLYKHLHSPVKYLKEDLEKFGKDTYRFEIIEYCPEKLLDERESYYIYKYNSLYPYGYNQQTGGKSKSKACKNLRQKFKKINKNKVIPNFMGKRLWVNDGVDNYYIKEEDYIEYMENGYREGKVNLKQKAGGLFAHKIN